MGSLGNRAWLAPLAQAKATAAQRPLRPRVANHALVWPTLLGDVLPGARAGLSRVASTQELRIPLYGERHAAAALKWRMPPASDRHLIMMSALAGCGRWIILRLSAQLAQWAGTRDFIAERNIQPPEANGRLPRSWRSVVKATPAAR